MFTIQSTLTEEEKWQNEPGKGGYPLDEHRDKISNEQYELESLSKDIKAAVRHILPNGGEA